MSGVPKPTGHAYAGLYETLSLRIRLSSLQILSLINQVKQIFTIGPVEHNALAVGLTFIFATTSQR